MKKKMVYKVDTGKPWLLRRGRNWISFDGWSQRRNGWWLFGYRIWTPKLWLLPVALAYRLFNGGNNFFYVKERRDKLHISDDVIFGE